MTELRPIRVAYADPPYPGCARKYSKPGTSEFHPDAMRWDDPEEHVRLMHELERDFPDGWALSTHSGALRELLHRSPPRARSAPWCGPSTGNFKVFRVAYCHEVVIYSTPLVFRRDAPGRPRAIDWVVAGKGHNSDVESAFIGAKPARFCRWLFELLGLGAHPGDELVDLFPGSGAVTRAWDDYRAARVERAGVAQLALFEGRA